VTDKGLISSVASGRGESGDIALNTGRADIGYGGTVLASSFGSGKAGNISIDAFESLRLAGTGGLYCCSRAVPPGAG
jgi:large exoprotein involved in heme utilization and adhesion